ncbi:hypothetical protein WICMUC_001162 [Wickerhamomyces mucosus]|uniref:RNA polymerase II-associated protein 1 n=1 Tax=Wickerhamomyces mucosus TaxID=1378264 RepID=A0A9P8PVL8_9ASCO|nr:hypothetical protein WICMUC_001162 [Wickerhamomyces mucosus]
MSKIQDYIAKIRYQNDLPVPLLPPKLLKNKVSEEENVGSSSLLTSLSRREAISNLITINHDLGITIDLVHDPDVFDGEKSSKLITNNKLHPKDRILLRDPGMGKVVKNQPNVSFLRRTEYIDSIKQNITSSSINTSRSATPSTNGVKGPAIELRSIEKTFENASKTLEDIKLLKHPLNKKLKAKRVWSLLPDVSRLDQKFSTIKFASKTNGINDLELSTAIYRQRKINEDNWVSFFTTDEESGKQVKRKLTDLSENIPRDDINENETRYNYIKRNDFDLKLSKPTEDISEIILRFDDTNNTVYYNPIEYKSELKRRKLLDIHQDTFEANNIDQLNIAIKEPTIKELNKRNSARHKHDSVTYGLAEDEDDEEDDLAELKQEEDNINDDYVDDKEEEQKQKQEQE